MRYGSRGGAAGAAAAATAVMAGRADPGGSWVHGTAALGNRGMAVVPGPGVGR